MTIDDQIWINGRWYGPGEGGISGWDRSFLLGDGCFETLRFAEGRIEGVESHLKLLRASASVLQIKGGPSDDHILAALDQLEAGLQDNRGEAAVRLTLSRGAGGRGASAMSAEPVMTLFATLLEEARPYPPLKLVTSSIRRNETSPLSTIKSTSYGENLSARQEALHAGADEALMLNMQGRAACLSMGNLILLRSSGDAPGELITPAPAEGARPGYMRNLLLEAARNSGWRIVETEVSLDLLNDRDVSMFGTNSLWGMRPVKELDGRAIKSASPVKPLVAV